MARGPILLILALVAAACAPRPTTVELEFREGTLMEVVPSPDGRSLALQLWQHIWILDADGGEARRLTNPINPPDEHWFPRWSPDGSLIAYSSMRADAGIVVVPVSGGSSERLTDGEFDAWPDWSPDGGTMVFSRYTGGIWTIPSEGGTPQRLTPDTLQATTPAWSPDGQWIAFSSNGRLHIINPNGGSIREVTVGPGDEAPSWSASGGQLFFLSSRSGNRQIWSVSLDGGELRQLTDDEDVYPFAPHWMPGRNAVVYAAGGRIRTLDPTSGTKDSIPFVARLSLPRPTYARKRPEIPAGGTRVPVRGIYKPAPSPDGSHIAFAALGDLWLWDEDGRTEQLTSGPADDGDVAWSPDGRAIGFVSDDLGDYQLYVLELATRERRRVTNGLGQTENPIWHPSGDSIVFVQRPWTQGTPTLQIVALTGGPSRPITHARAIDVKPLGWAADGQSLLYQQLSFDPQTFEMTTTVMQQGSEGPRPILEGQFRGQLDFVALSHDAQRWAYVDRGELYIRSLDADSVGRRVGTRAAYFPAWSADGNLVYTSGGKLRRVDVTTGRDRDLLLDLAYEVPSAGTLVVRNARLLTPEPREGLWDLFLADGLIESIQPSGGQPLEADSVIDVEGRIVMPGLMDLHAHVFRGSFPAEGYLYWGVTSIGSAGGEGHWTVQLRESIEAGRKSGPRIFPAGGFVVASGMNAFPQMLRVDTEEQLERHLDHLAGLGATQIKHYQRRNPWIEAATVSAAHRRGIPVLSHFIAPAAVAVGLDRKEHAFYSAWNGEVTAQYRQDVLEILEKTSITLTPTLAFAGTPLDSSGTDRIQPDFSDPEVSNFLQPSAVGVVQRRHARRTQQAGSPESQRMLRAMLANTAAAQDGGVRIATGTDWQPGYLALHWELALLVEAGLSPLEALRAATANAAYALGMDGRLGSIEEGAVADLLVLDADPMQDIRNTQKIYAVVKNGQLINRKKLLNAARTKHEGR